MRSGIRASAYELHSDRDCMVRYEHGENVGLEDAKESGQEFRKVTK